MKGFLQTLLSTLFIVGSISISERFEMYVRAGYSSPPHLAT